MEIQGQIYDYIVEHILFGNGEGLDADTSFQEGGILDSTGFLEIITFIEEHFGIQIEDSEVVPEHFGTLRKISRFVEAKLSTKAVTQRDLSQIQSTGSRT